MEAARVVTVSDRSARGERPDATGPVLVARLREAGWDAAGALVPDGADSVRAAIAEAVASGARLVVTTGGTGIGPRDETPEGTAPLLARTLPGIPEEIRRRGGSHGMLSRALAGIATGPGGRGALVANLPGSPGGAADGLDVVLSVAAHVLSQLDGGDHDAAAHRAATA
ncbi:MogA/MoaB family molybdenum cofactor biosynthesis protein [Agromyces archimandritae]|uniref:MogA/MoaB family molybdenum cofactor biosynthesis protein n=1 Tax=Agromyces archimandritae TaxID=2781962 RepID=A0A975IMT5_9MICO|nr:MogA/MoaB family molybdenum cofactor biosynthesis protein [Agromyces archimandritae]QTX03863.1 MogA/MoaB family molybdenum cofactor biosynthesis protein [Agromyces archimandritae]